jgi:hypothetical protein
VTDVICCLEDACTSFLGEARTRALGAGVDVLGFDDYLKHYDLDPQPVDHVRGTIQHVMTKA